MHYSLSSTTFSAGIMAGLLALGAMGHHSATSGLNWASPLDGSAQALYEAGFERDFAAQALAVDVMGAVKYALFAQASDGAIVGQNGWLFTTEELDVTADFDAHIAASAARVRDAVKALQARGIAVLPVIVPDKAEIYADQLGLTRPDAVAARRDHFAALLHEAGIEALDATPVLRDVKETQNAFMPDDTHWSPAGSQAVAVAVADALAGIPLAPATVTTTATGAVLFDGDLLRYVPTGDLRGLVGPVQQQIATFDTTVETEAGLFGDASVDVALVGTSFSAKSDWHFDGFLKQALQADVVNFAEQGKGPFAPMDAFLASEFLTSTPPKVVIWEIPARYVSKEQ